MLEFQDEKRQAPACPLCRRIPGACQFEWQKTQYAYDSYGRLTSQSFTPLGASTPDPNQTVTYYYDSNPIEPTFSTNATGRLAAVQMNANIGMWYEYDYLGSGKVQHQRVLLFHRSESRAWV
jgi:hypothetical protein